MYIYVKRYIIKKTTTKVHTKHGSYKNDFGLYLSLQYEYYFPRVWIPVPTLDKEKLCRHATVIWKIYQGRKPCKRLDTSGVHRAPLAPSFWNRSLMECSIEPALLCFTAVAVSPVAWSTQIPMYFHSNPINCPLKDQFTIFPLPRSIYLEEIYILRYSYMYVINEQYNT